MPFTPTSPVASYFTVLVIEEKIVGKPLVSGLYITVAPLSGGSYALTSAAFTVYFTSASLSAGSYASTAAESTPAFTNISGLIAEMLDEIVERDA